MNISHNFFIYFKDNQPLVYNFKTKDEFSIRREYLRTLINYSKTSTQDTSNERILNDFIENDILTIENNKEKPYLNYFAHIFHNITKDTSVTMSNSTEEEWASKYIEICERVQEEKLPERETIKDFDIVYKLPDPDKMDVKFYDMLKKRKTIREFEQSESSIEKLSNLLYYTFGYIHGEEEDYLPFKRRSSPSGGCLQIIEPYIAIFNVEGIDKGVYWYEPNTHSICKVNDYFTYQNLRECLAGQFFGNDCSFGIFYVANLEMLAWKYKTPRNYKVVFLEAGHFSQTSQLVATSLSLDTWVTGAFKDSDIEKHCKLDGISKIPVFFTAYGKGKFSHMHTAMKKKLEEKKQKKNIL